MLDARGWAAVASVRAADRDAGRRTTERAVVSMAADIIRKKRRVCRQDAGRSLSELSLTLRDRASDGDILLTALFTPLVVWAPFARDATLSDRLHLKLRLAISASFLNTLPRFLLPSSLLIYAYPAMPTLQAFDSGDTSI